MRTRCPRLKTSICSTGIADAAMARSSRPDVEKRRPLQQRSELLRTVLATNVADVLVVKRRHSIRTGELSCKEICVEALSHSQTRFMRRAYS